MSRFGRDQKPPPAARIASSCLPSRPQWLWQISSGARSSHSLALPCKMQHIAWLTPAKCKCFSRSIPRGMPLRLMELWSSLSRTSWLTTSRIVPMEISKLTSSIRTVWWLPGSMSATRLLSPSQWSIPLLRFITLRTYWSHLYKQETKTWLLPSTLLWVTKCHLKPYLLWHSLIQWA